MSYRRHVLAKEVVFFSFASDEIGLIKTSSGVLSVIKSLDDIKAIDSSDVDNLVLKIGSKIIVTKSEYVNGSVSAESKLIDTLDGQTIFLSHDIFPSRMYRNKLLSYRYDDGKEFLLCHSFQESEFVEEWEICTQFRPLLCFDKVVFGVDSSGRNLISGISLVNGELIWQFDCSELGVWKDYDRSIHSTEVFAILGIWNGVMWIILNSGKLLLVDSVNGRKIDVIDNDKNINETFMSGWFRKGLIYMDEKQGKLIQLADQFYTEVDLQTREVSHQQVQDMIDIDLKNQSTFSFNEENLYFIDKTNFKMGILDRRTLKITWSYTFDQSDVNLKEERPRMPQELKLAENSVYVLDNKRTLHVFEEVGENSATTEIF